MCRRIGAATLGAWLLLATMSAALAASLAELIPADAGLAIEARGLGEQWREFAQSEIFRRAREYAPVRKWWDQRGAGIAAVARHIEQRLGVPVQELPLKLLGHETVLAVWPPEDGRGAPPTLLVARTPETDIVRRTVDGIVSLFRDAGRVDEVKSALPGTTIHRVRPKDPAELYIAAIEVSEPSGGVLIISTRLNLVEHVIARLKQPEGESLAANESYQRAIASLDNGAVLRACLLPRAWDSVIHQALSAQSGAAPRLEREIFLKSWQASAFLAVGLTQKSAAGAPHALELQARWQCAETLPTPLAELFGSLSGGSALADDVPADALLRVSGRVDMERILETFCMPNKALGGRIIAPPDNDVFGWAVSMALLSGAGPDVAAYVVAAPENADVAAGWPLDWVAGVETHAIGDRDGATLSETLEPVLRRALQFSAAANEARHPGSPTHVETEQVGGHEVTVLRGVKSLKPRGMIALAAAGSRLWMASAPESLGSISRTRAANGAKSARPTGWEAEIHVARLRDQLVRWPQAVDVLSGGREEIRPRVEQSWWELLELLSLVDRASLTADFAAEGVRLHGIVAADAK